MNNSINLKPITLEDKALLDSYFKNNCTQNSEFTFTNLFMWRKSYNICYAIIDGMLTIIPKHGEGPRSVTYPLGNGDKKVVIEKLLHYFKENGEEPLIRLYSENSIKELEEMFPDTFIFTEDVGSHDYVYKTEDLINLSGSKYHSKRNHTNRFKSTYNYEYHTMTPELRDQCMNMFNDWCETKAELIPGINEQYEAVSELLSNWESLDITGGCITVDGKMVAFSFGEPLCSEKRMAVIHLEHANTDYNGSFATINQQFLENEWSDFEYVNREEDMGLTGLRKAKQSYHPSFLVKKYVATLKHF